MQFDDVRVMMRLPLPEVGLRAGLNFSAAVMLCNLISGISVVLYTPPSSKLRSGEKFKTLLENYYPWEIGENKKDKAKIIYDLIRNPLAHSLGVLKKGVMPISIEKSPLGENQLENIEYSEMRPTWVPLAITYLSVERKNLLSVSGLYWGVFQLLKRIARDEKQMQEAEKRFKHRRISK